MYWTKFSLKERLNGIVKTFGDQNVIRKYGENDKLIFK
jgi:hypothetical protein